MMTNEPGTLASVSYKFLLLPPGRSGMRRRRCFQGGQAEWDVFIRRNAVGYRFTAEMWWARPKEENPWRWPKLKQCIQLSCTGKGTEDKEKCRAQIADARGQAMGKKRDVRITVWKMDEVTRGGHSAEHLLMKCLWIYKWRKRCKPPVPGLSQCLSILHVVDPGKGELGGLFPFTTEQLKRKHQIFMASRLKENS